VTAAGSNQQPSSDNNEQITAISTTTTELKMMKQTGEDHSTTAVQLAKATIRERNCSMLNNEMLSDVHFQVGPPGSSVTIPAHKYVLSIGSSVFLAMFHGDLKEKKATVPIPDVEPSAFLTLLRYLYCDEIKLEADNVLATLYTAKKYLVPHLAQACVRFLETSLNYKNACILLSQSCLFEENDLKRKCWEVIDAQTELALEADSFLDIDYSTLEMIAGRDTLNVHETAVYSAVCRWAEAECRRKNLLVAAGNKRKVLGDVLFSVRIPAMSLQEFADGPAKDDILTKEEVISTFFWYSATEKPALPFPITSRKGLKARYCKRFQSCAYRSNQWRYRGRCDSISFMPEKRIFVAGFGLYGSSTGAANYTVRIRLLQCGQVLAEEMAAFFSDGCSKTFHVWFKHPVQCEAGQYYTASAVLDGNELSYFGQEGLSEVHCSDDVTIQFQCSSDSTNGTGVQGGQIPELIFYHGSE